MVVSIHNMECVRYREDVSEGPLSEVRLYQQAKVSDLKVGIRELSFLFIRWSYPTEKHY